jgi:hypothetical protein
MKISRLFGTRRVYPVREPHDFFACARAGLDKPDPDCENQMLEPEPMQTLARDGRDADWP